MISEDVKYIIPLLGGALAFLGGLLSFINGRLNDAKTPEDRRKVFSTIVAILVTLLPVVGLIGETSLHIPFFMMSTYLVVWAITTYGFLSKSNIPTRAEIVLYNVYCGIFVCIIATSLSYYSIEIAYHGLDVVMEGIKGNMEIIKGIMGILEKMAHP